MMRSHLSGFTMIELMVVLAVTVILVTLVVPSFTDQLARRRLEGATTELSSDLQYARSQAVSNNATTTLATNAGGTQYTITSGGTTYKTVTLDSQLNITPSVTITYDQLRAMATASGAMTVSSSKTNGLLQVTVTPMGRVSVCSPSGSLKGYSSC
jgi:prepilin-type N-terminal cleavage/methylation domain-containing protein